MIFRYILLGLVAYWLFKRVFKIRDAVRTDRHPSQPQAPKKEPKKDKHGGEYVDYEEVE